MNLKDSVKEPSNTFKSNMLLAEHSPIRSVMYLLEMEEIPNWVSQHIARHDAYAMHTVRDSKEQHFVGTSRTDRTSIDRNKLPQDNPVNHTIVLSAQDFITISRKRLCNCASKETIKVWKEVISVLKGVDPILASKCVSECLFRGFCPEFKNSCKFDKTEMFKIKLYNYRYDT